MQNDVFEYKLWRWAEFRSREVKHETGWAVKSVGQTMIESGQLGALIPGTKTVGHVPTSFDVKEVIAAIGQAHLSNNQRAALYLHYNFDNRTKRKSARKYKAQVMGVSVKSYADFLREAQVKLKKCLLSSSLL